MSMGQYEAKRALRNFRYLPSGKIQVKVLPVDGQKSVTSVLNSLKKSYGAQATLDTVIKALAANSVVAKAAESKIKSDSVTWRDATAAEVGRYWRMRILIEQCEVSYLKRRVASAQSDIDNAPARLIQRTKQRDKAASMLQKHEVALASIKARAEMATARPAKIVKPKKVKPIGAEALPVKTA